MRHRCTSEFFFSVLEFKPRIYFHLTVSSAESGSFAAQADLTLLGDSGWLQIPDAPASVAQMLRRQLWNYCFVATI